MRLLKSRIFTLTLRRSAWIRWLPPIDSASPSPVTTHTERSGRVAARPVAIAGARPAGAPPRLRRTQRGRASPALRRESPSRVHHRLDRVLQLARAEREAA